MGDGTTGTMEAARPADPINSGAKHMPDRVLGTVNVDPMPGLVTGWNPDKAASTITGPQVTVEASPPALDSLGAKLPPVEAEDEKAPEDVTVTHEPVEGEMQGAGPVVGIRGTEASADPEPQGTFDASRIGGETAEPVKDVQAGQEPITSKFIPGAVQPENQGIDAGVALNPRSAASIVDSNPAVGEVKPDDHKTLGQKIGDGLKRLWPFGHKAPAIVPQVAPASGSGVIPNVDSFAAIPGVEANPGQLPQSPGQPA